MFELNKAIEEWQRPFRLSHIYSVDTIEELTHHLLDRYEEFLDQGSCDEVAFDKAVGKVGDEISLNDEHRKEWKSTPWHLRLLAAFRLEWQWIEKPTLRSLYIFGRLWTLGLGLWWVILIPLSIWRLIFRSDGWWFQPNQWFYLQGEPMLHLLGIASVFILIPFKPWSRTPENWLRVAFALLVVYTVFHNLRIAILDLGIYGGGDAFMWEVWLGLAPMMWVIQMFGRNTTLALKPRLDLSQSARLLKT